MSRVFVFDLDGVIRHWDPEIVSNAERTNGLPAGALFGVAFESDLLLAAVTGTLTDDAWRAEVANRLQAEYPDADGTGAVTDWGKPHGEIVEGSLDVLARVRKFGPVCLLSNATSRLNTDLVALDIIEEFDHIFNSSEIGFAKPDERIYAHIEQALGVDPAQIVYLDDGAANVQAANARGWNGILIEPGASLMQLVDSWMR